jgi:hypothetical protein
LSTPGQLTTILASATGSLLPPQKLFFDLDVPPSAVLNTTWKDGITIFFTPFFASLFRLSSFSRSDSAYTPWLINTKEITTPIANLNISRLLQYLIIFNIFNTS